MVEIVRPLTTRMVVPLRGSTIVTLAILASLLFIICISFAFIGSDADAPLFMQTLNTVAEKSPGVVLIGESVDVDIDEPSVTIRWSIVACGDNFMLPGSAGVHGTQSCGLPDSAMYFFVDSDVNPTATYDPSQIPFNKDTGHRRSIQNLVQFDSDHVLDVHEDRLYPFDTYMLSSSIRAMSFDNQTISIRKLATINITSSFDINTIDIESFSTLANGTDEASRDIDMYISRPNEARFFALLLFVVSWILTHVTIGHVLIARKLDGLRAILPTFMPDAPGLDDCIGYFPQMIIVNISTIALLLILVAHEFDYMRNPDPLPIPLTPSSPQRHVSTISRFSRPPRSPTANSSSMEIAQWEMLRLMKHLKGEFVFPPVKPSHRLMPSDPSKASHRRVKTMSKIMEAGEVSHWSDSE
ncbi:hypothetical protein BJ912DRAFT_1021254 [Pholiota molesta]|nr:hypothetical protein BJ912DRAFT_1021254 [Pholiota molesta]